MSTRRRFTRRRFIAGAAMALGGATLTWLNRFLGVGKAAALDPTLTPMAYLPFVVGGSGSAGPTPVPGEARVVHVRDAGATAWTGSGYFYNAVSQSAVDTMVQAGLQHLTGYMAWADIWGALFGRVHSGGYAIGQKIAIKVNFNNSERDSNDCDTHNNLVDALPHPVLAVIKGMVAAGVQAGDITIYDATGGVGRYIPDYFRNPITTVYPGVHFVGRSACSGVTSPGYGKDPSLTVPFSDPGDRLDDRLLANVLYDATYLINVPIVKRHGGNSYIPVSLGFKNHLGSINRVSGAGDDDLHAYLETTGAYYQTTHNPLVDIYANPNIRDKTALTLGDGLYGGFGAASSVPTSWNTFGDAPNSLFFSVDPVAVDCVMADFLIAEGQISTPRTYDYLFCAAEAGLGICEGARSDPGGNPWQTPYGSGYNDITYVRVDLTAR